jgi:trimethylamine--corrinoid protein Co-methyltransferase
MARYRTAFYLPVISDRNNYDAWQEKGASDAAQRAHHVAQQLLAAYEPPAVDKEVEEELRAYVKRRKEVRNKR